MDTFSTYRLREAVAREMVDRGVEPRAFIRAYLDHQALVSEGAVTGLFRRLKQAWDGFWTKPRETPTDYLGTARKSLGELMTIVKSQPNPVDADMVLNGLQQALRIMDKVEPYVQRLNPGQTGSQPRLPDDLQQTWDAIGAERDRLLNLPDNDPRKTQLLRQNDDKFLHFLAQLEEMPKRMSNADPNLAARRQQIVGFLRYLDDDTDFQHFQQLMTQVRDRGTDMATERPAGWDRVVMAYQQAVNAKTDPQQALTQMYRSLLDNHPMKQFIRREARFGRDGGQPEEVLLTKYAKYWATKYPHHREDA